MTTWLNHRQSLELIEHIASNESELNPKNKAMVDIYTIAHSVVAPKVCFVVHKDWREKWAKIYNSLKKNKII